MLSAVDVPWTETRPGSFGNRKGSIGLWSGKAFQNATGGGGGGRNLKCHVDIESWLCIHWMHK